MKRHISLLLIILSCTSCFKNLDNNNLAENRSFAWGASIDEVKATINESTIIFESTDEIILNINDRYDNMFVSYQFLKGKLKNTLVIFLSNSSVYKKEAFLRNYSHQGLLSSTDIYTNPSTNTLCVSYIEGNYSILGFTELNSTSDEPEEGEHNGYKWVDLGLPSGVKWATMDVGASAEGENGKYYSWGSLEASRPTCWNDYEYFLGEFYGSLQLKEIGSDISGNKKYDVAANKWGGSWRIPTEAECSELVNNCTIETMDNGCKVIGSNGKFIILPFSGQSTSQSATYNCTWTSTQAGYYTASYMCGTSVIINKYNDVPGGQKWIGYTVRPVLTLE